MLAFGDSPLARAAARFCRVVAAAALASGLAAAIAFFAAPSEGVTSTVALVGTAALTALDKFLRERGIY